MSEGSGAHMGGGVDDVVHDGDHVGQAEDSTAQVIRPFLQPPPVGAVLQAVTRACQCHAAILREIRVRFWFQGSSKHHVTQASQRNRELRRVRPALSYRTFAASTGNSSASPNPNPVEPTPFCDQQSGSIHFSGARLICYVSDGGDGQLHDL